MSRSKSKQGSPKRVQRHALAASPEHALARATEEITEKLEEIARAAREVRNPDVVSSSGETTPLAIDLRGAQLVNHGLFCQKTAAASVDVISIQATVHPDKLDCINVRIDCWNGYTVLTLPRDRAALLVKKIEQAVEHTRTPIVPNQPVTSESNPLVIAYGKPRSIRPARVASRPTRRARVLQATDRVLDDLLDNGSLDESKKSH